MRCADLLPYFFVYILTSGYLDPQLYKDSIEPEQLFAQMSSAYIHNKIPRPPPKDQPINYSAPSGLLGQALGVMSSLSTAVDGDQLPVNDPIESQPPVLDPRLSRKRRVVMCFTMPVMLFVIYWMWMAYEAYVVLRVVDQDIATSKAALLMTCNKDALSVKEYDQKTVQMIVTSSTCAQHRQIAECDRLNLFTSRWLDYSHTTAVFVPGDLAFVKTFLYWTVAYLVGNWLGWFCSVIAVWMLFRFYWKLIVRPWWETCKSLLYVSNANLIPTSVRDKSD